VASRVTLHELARELNRLVERRQVLEKELLRVTLAQSWNFVHVRKTELEYVMEQIKDLERRVARHRASAAP